VSTLAPLIAQARIPIGRRTVIERPPIFARSVPMFTVNGAPDSLNRVNFDVPDRVAFTPNFGRIFSAKPAHKMQFGLKFLF